MSEINYSISKIECLYKDSITYTKNGSRLIKNVPHVAPQAYLHRIFTGLLADDVAMLEGELGIKLPEDYSNFLKISNGISLFSGLLDIFGKRFNYVRSVESVLEQPFDVLIPNVYEKSNDNNYFFVGAIGCEAANIFYKQHNSPLFVGERNGNKIIGEWPSINIFLDDVFEKLFPCFDENGVKIRTNVFVQSVKLIK